MTPDEIDAAIGRGLLRMLLRNLKLSPDDWRAFKTTGIPLDWAEALAAASEGELKVADFPRVIHPPRLTGTLDPVKVDEMDTDHRLAISAKLGGKRDKEFKAAMRAKKFTQESLAEEAKISPSMLSRARAGERAIRKAKAMRIQALIGWPADKAHWPGGLVDD